jgi:hypothetical protein
MRARQEAYEAQLRRAAEKQKAEREARRPVCADCQAQFTDDRWKAVEPREGDSPQDTHPHLCDACKARAIDAERHAKQAERERQQQKEELAAQKASGWLSCLRT